VKKLTPIGLLILSAVLAIAGLFLLSTAQGLVMIFAFATLYGIGKTFFWPTMLGVVSEQCPKGGALTLNAIAGIGMLTVGILGGPLIGKMQEDSVKTKLQAEEEGLYEQISVDSKYILGDYTAVDAAKLGALTEEKQAETQELIEQAKQGSLAKITIFPFFMLVCYIILGLYFKQKGGYKSVQIGEEAMKKGDYPNE